MKYSRKLHLHVITVNIVILVDLTVDLTKYLQSCANKLCSKSKSVSDLLLLLKPVEDEPSAATTTDNNGGEQMDTTVEDSGRRPSVSGSGGGELSEVTKWSYCTRLTDWLYHVSCVMWYGNQHVSCGMGINIGYLHIMYLSH